MAFFKKFFNFPSVRADDDEEIVDPQQVLRVSIEIVSIGHTDCIFHLDPRQVQGYVQFGCRKYVDESSDEEKLDTTEASKTNLFLLFNYFTGKVLTK